MICTSRRLGNDLIKIDDKNIIMIDENDNEYIIEAIVQRKLHMDDDKNWCHAIKARKTNSGCIKR